MADIEIVNTFYRGDAWKGLFTRRHYIGRESGMLYCKKCRWAIRFLATPQRLFVKKEGLDKSVHIEDTKQIVRVVVPFCPQCDPTPTLIFEDIVFLNDLTDDRIPAHDPKKVFTYREQEYGHFICDQVFQGNLCDYVTKVTFQAVIESTQMGQAVPDSLYELALLNARLQDPKYILKCKYNEAKAEREARTKAALERQAKERKAWEARMKAQKRMTGQ